MLPSNTDIIIENESVQQAHSSGRLQIFAIKLTEDVVRKLLAQQQQISSRNNERELIGVSFTLSANGKADRLKIGVQDYELNRFKETQPVQLARYETQKRKLCIIGKVENKLGLRQELAASKAEEIRQRTKEAERERLSRKTVELTVVPAGKGTKKVVRNVVNKPTAAKSTSQFKLSITDFPLRTRIIQLLALEALTADALASKLATRKESLWKDLHAVADILNGIFHLKPNCHGEVKVADWPYYSMRERGIVMDRLKEQQEQEQERNNGTETPESACLPSPDKTESPQSTPPGLAAIKSLALNVISSTPTTSGDTNTPAKIAPKSVVKKPSTVKDRLNKILSGGAKRRVPETSRPSKRPSMGI